MVAGYHLTWTAYGYWLPNEPRGSTSIEVRIAAPKPLGGIHFGRKKIQPSADSIADFHEKAQDVLKNAVLTFDQDDIQFIGKIIGQEIATRKMNCYACAVMPDHVHLLIRRACDSAEQMVEAFQEITRTALIDAGKGSPTHPTWTKGPGWKGFMNTQRDFTRQSNTFERIRWR